MCHVAWHVWTAAVRNTGIATLLARLYPVKRTSLTWRWRSRSATAVAGALLGARDGLESIPRPWREGLRGREAIADTADALLELATEDA